MHTTIGEFVVGFGELFRIADVWKGSQGNEAAVMLESISNDAWSFQWIPMKELFQHFEEVERV